VARILDIPFMCLHTPADKLCDKILSDLFEDKKPDLISEVMELLNEIPEYRQAADINAGPSVIVGE